MSTTNPSHAINGVGQHGFVARHGLYSAEQAAAADEVAARIRELGLSTVRLVVVDQHGVPRSKSLSAEVAIAALSNGLDFSGAIYSLDSGNQVFVPAFAAGGGFGIDELTGFPDVVLVPDPARSGFCRGPTGPAGCCATSTSPAARRCRWTAAA